jgi:hypothetical protein
MTHRFRLVEEDEPKIFKSLQRIAEYYIRASKYITRYAIDYTEEIIYKKNVVKLPKEFRIKSNEFAVLKIGKYELQKKECFESLPNLLELQCHIDDRGNILSVYIIV